MKCPKCGSKDIKKYVYGYMSECKEDEIMGGCVISDTSSSHHCIACESDLGTYSTFYEVRHKKELQAVVSNEPYEDSITIYPGALILKTVENGELIKKLELDYTFIECNEFLQSTDVINVPSKEEAKLLIKGTMNNTKKVFHKIDTFKDTDFIGHLEVVIGL